MSDLQSVLESGESREREVGNADGDSFLQRVRPYRSPEGHIDGVVITFTDVSAVKRVEEARYADLARSNRDLQDFAYAVSHDLQSPLRHISDGCIELSKSLHAIATEEHRDWLKQIGSSSELLSRMIQALLTYSRVSTRGKAFSDTDCAKVVSVVLEDLRDHLEECGARVSVGELPRVNCDDIQLNRVFYELVSNAICYRGTRPLRISITAEKKAGEWVFQVADNGVGIEERHYERVFIIFQRLGFIPEVKGDGLGLALCKRIIERHGGRITVESVPGEGSTFSFSLPDHSIN